MSKRTMYEQWREERVAYDRQHQELTTGDRHGATIHYHKGRRMIEVYVFSQGAGGFPEYIPLGKFLAALNSSVKDCERALREETAPQGEE